MQAKGLLVLTIGVVILTTLFVGLVNVSAQTNSAAKIAATGPGTRVVSVGLTNVTLAVNNSAPTVDQPITFTATLTNGSTPLSSKTVTIYHYFNSTRYDDIDLTTNATGQVQCFIYFSTAGQRTYYAVFAGDSSDGVATSNAVVVDVR